MAICAIQPLVGAAAGACGEHIGARLGADAERCHREVQRDGRVAAERAREHLRVCARARVHDAIELKAATGRVGDRGLQGRCTQVEPVQKCIRGTDSTQAVDGAARIKVGRADKRPGDIEIIERRDPQLFDEIVLRAASQCRPSESTTCTEFHDRNILVGDGCGRGHARPWIKIDRAFIDRGHIHATIVVGRDIV